MQLQNKLYVKNLIFIKTVKRTEVDLKKVLMKKQFFYRRILIVKLVKFWSYVHQSLRLVLKRLNIKLNNLIFFILCLKHFKKFNTFLLILKSARKLLRLRFSFSTLFRVWEKRVTYYFTYFWLRFRLVWNLHFIQFTRFNVFLAGKLLSNYIYFFKALRIGYIYKIFYYCLIKKFYLLKFFFYKFFKKFLLGIGLPKFRAKSKLLRNKFRFLKQKKYSTLKIKNWNFLEKYFYPKIDFWDLRYFNVFSNRFTGFTNLIREKLLNSSYKELVWIFVFVTRRNVFLGGFRNDGHLLGQLTAYTAQKKLPGKRKYLQLSKSCTILALKFKLLLKRKYPNQVDGFLFNILLRNSNNAKVQLVLRPFFSLFQEQVVSVIDEIRVTHSFGLRSSKRRRRKYRGKKSV
jgi:hypothetical protein